MEYPSKSVRFHFMVHFCIVKNVTKDPHSICVFLPALFSKHSMAFLRNCICVFYTLYCNTASGMTAEEVEGEEVGEQGWGDDVDILLEDGMNSCCCVFLCSLLQLQLYVSPHCCNR